MTGEQMVLPYGDSQVSVQLPAGKTVDVYTPDDLPGAPDGIAEVRRAMAQPIDTPPLVQLARGRKCVAIVIDDATRPVPNYQMLRPIVDELRQAGISNEQITVVVATGLHRAVTVDEARQLVGSLPLNVVSHDAHDRTSLVPIGTTARGARLSVNRIVAEADIRILTGDVELHQFVGYGGGAKSVMPGIADAQTIQHTHEQMEVKGTGPGRFEGNPVRAEVEESADMLGVDYIVNVVLNSRHEIVRAFAGDVHKAFIAGTGIVDQMYKVPVARPYDLVLTSAGGYPRDIDLYQSQKAITSARRMTTRGGAVVAFAECREGHGSQLAYEWAKAASCPQDIVDRHRAGFVIGAHKAYQLARDVLYADVYMHSAMPADVVETFFLKPIDDLTLIEAMMAEAQSIALLPQATLMLPVLPGQGQVDF